MEKEFDPYHHWLGIPPDEQPPHHYRLLGIPLFEANATVIENAAEQRMAYLRTIQTGPRAKLSQKVLNEIAAARRCLLTTNKRDAYDEELRQNLTPEEAASAEIDLALPPSASSLPTPPPPPVPPLPPRVATTDPQSPLPMGSLPGSIPMATAADDAPLLPTVVKASPTIVGPESSDDPSDIAPDRAANSGPFIAAGSGSPQGRYARNRLRSKRRRIPTWLVTAIVILTALLAFVIVLAVASFAVNSAP